MVSSCVFRLLVPVGSGGQAHLPDLEVVQLALQLLIERLSRLSSTAVGRSSQVGKAGLPPLPRLQLDTLDTRSDKCSN
jgi:hypothetical protein